MIIWMVRGDPYQFCSIIDWNKKEEASRRLFLMLCSAKGRCDCLVLRELEGDGEVEV